jgi:hypothetical protein
MTEERLLQEAQMKKINSNETRIIIKRITFPAPNANFVAGKAKLGYTF